MESEDEVRQMDEGPLEGPSPKKAKGDRPLSVDMDILRQMMADQVAQIASAQKTALNEVAAALRKDIDDCKADLQKGQKETDKRVDDVEGKVGRLLQRVERLEQGAAPSGAREEEERHRTTLVWGGWGRETPRGVILKQLEGAMERLEVQGLCDHKPFTTGARRSMALQSFAVRQGENMVGVRGRMSAIIAAVNNAELYVGDRDKGDEKKLWVSFSRPREVRLNGAHAAMVRRTVRSLAPTMENELEVEYPTGTAWLSGRKIASAKDEAEGALEGDLYRDEDRASRPWVNVQKLATILQVTQDRVRATVNEQRR